MRIRRFLAFTLVVVAALPLTGLALGSAPAGAATGSFPVPSVVGLGTAHQPRELSGTLNAPIVGMASDPSGSGFWLVASDGGVFSFGSAHFYGSTGAMHLWQPIVGMAATPTGHGYWLVAADGGIFSFGDAHFYGSTGGIHLAQPIVGMAATPSGGGYWLAAADGGIFTFGNAHFYGSAAPVWKSAPAVGIATSASGKGYEVQIGNGPVVRFGDAPGLNDPSGGNTVSAITRSPTGGYWTLGLDGHVYTTGATRVANAPQDATAAIGIAPTNDGKGYWVARVPTGPAVPANSGSGRRIVYSNSQQRIWVIEANGVVTYSWLVSGRTGTPPFGTYSIQRRLAPDTAGDLILPYFQGFLRGSSGKWFGFHGIPLNPNGTPIEPDDQLGRPESHGCIRLSQADAAILWTWGTLGTVVVAVP
ncbi:MAG TPA: L,D-transpeptidase [Acidimicrobiia bacterium]|jgi:hypothetical protein